MYDNSSRVIEVDINEVLPNRFQPRIQFDEEEILELSDSIKEHGVIQPLVVRTVGDKYEIIAGERRYKASVLAGKETVPVIVKNLNDKDSAEIALIENIQRKNLTPIEEALSYKKILDMGYITQENLASKLGKSQSAVANKIRLLNLSDEVQEALLENKISERHARSLLKLSTSKQQNEMLHKIISERLTVRKADEEIEKMKNNNQEDGDNDTQKIIEKGEIDMNNNMFGMPNVPQSTGFDIFGTGSQEPIQTQTVVNDTTTPVTSNSIPTFDIFGGSTSTVEHQPQTAPVMETPAVSEIPTMPTTPVFEVSPTMEVSVPEAQPMAPVMETPAVSEIPTMPTTPVFEVNPTMEVSVPEAQPMAPVMETPAVSEIPTMPTTPVFEVNPTMEVSVPEAQPMAPVMETPAVSEIPTMPTTPIFEVSSTMGASVPEPQPVPTVIETPAVPEFPQTAPIIETPIDNSQVGVQQKSENLFSFGENNLDLSENPQQPTEPTIPEFKIPEPIIITDYSKQYDPIMPTTEPVAPSVDFKEVINVIRECSKKIEQYGFKLDLEEYDLANLYQVIFKIEK